RNLVCFDHFDVLVSNSSTFGETIPPETTIVCSFHTLLVWWERPFDIEGRFTQRLTFTSSCSTSLITSFFCPIHQQQRFCLRRSCSMCVRTVLFSSTPRCSIDLWRHRKLPLLSFHHP